jgi:dephospho-CoA kinase
MTHLLDHIIPNWLKIGINKKDGEELVDNYIHLVYLSQLTKSKPQSEMSKKICIDSIVEISNKYEMNLEGFHKNSKALIYPNEYSIDLVKKELNEGKIVGLCGMPASGKSTLIKKIKEELKTKKISYIDEFWEFGKEKIYVYNNTCEDISQLSYEDEKDFVKEQKLKQEPCLVAGALLDKSLVDTSIYIECPIDLRYENLISRYEKEKREEDIIRINNRDIYDLLDIITYATQIIESDKIIRKKNL